MSARAAAALCIALALAAHAHAGELTRRAATEREKGRLDAAEALARQSINALKTGDRVELAEALAELGVILAVKGDAPRAQVALAKAEALARQVRGDEDLAVAAIQNRRAAAATLRGDHVAATASLRKVLAVREKKLPPGHPDLGSTVFDLAESLEQQLLHDEAAPHYQRALQLATAAFPAGHPARMLIQRRAALNATRRGKAREAAALLAPIVRAPPGPTQAERARWSDTALAFAEAQEQAGEWKEAAQTYRDLLAVQEQAFGAESELLADTLTALARSLKNAGDAPAADAVQKRLERLEQ